MKPCLACVLVEFVSRLLNLGFWVVAVSWGRCSGANGNLHVLSCQRPPAALNASERLYLGDATLGAGAHRFLCHIFIPPIDGKIDRVSQESTSGRIVRLCQLLRTLPAVPVPTNESTALGLSTVGASSLRDVAAAAS